MQSLNETICIAICTYKRPQMLQACLESVLNQKTELKYSIIVVDNDKNGSSKHIIHLVQEQHSGREIKYIIEDCQGLSYARNRAAYENKCDLLIFIDDDEVAEENWLQNMVECQIQYKADVVLGRVIYKIPDHFPKYVKNSIYFSRKYHKNGSLANINDGYSGNTLIRANLFTLRQYPFLLDYNKVGGEDTEFFNFLLSKECKIVFCEDGIIWENQDDKRLSKKWYLIRGYRVGWNFSKHIIERPSVILSLLKLVKSIIGGLFYSFILLFLSVLNFDKYFLYFLLKGMSQIGKIGYFLGVKVEEY